MVHPIGVGGLPKNITYEKPVKRRKKDDSEVLSVAVGQKVYHKEYGSGIIEYADEYSIKVRFNKNKALLRPFTIPNDFLKGVLR